MSQKAKESIVFFGSGPVGLASLKALAENFAIEAVVTKPNPNSSRAPRLVAQWAETQKLKLLQPADSGTLITAVKSQRVSSSLGVVIDYGLLIGQDVIDSFGLGIVNSHFSLLPEWRGADPITFSLLSGQPTTGVSLMLINSGLDEGDLLSQDTYNIQPNETIDSLTSNLVHLSNQMLQRDLPKYLAGQLTPYPQDTSQEPSYSRKLTKADGRIDWDKPVKQLEREVRAYLGWPGSYTNLEGRDLTIVQAHASDASGPQGQPFRIGKQLGIYCGEGALIVERLKPAGKQEMDSASYINGYFQDLG